MTSIKSSLSEAARISEAVPCYADLVFLSRALSPLPLSGSFSRDRNQQGASNHFTRASLARLFQSLMRDGERCQRFDGSRAVGSETLSTSRR
jgi:hypothetical protein